MLFVPTLFQEEPPVYNLTALRVPFEMYFSADDLIAGPATIKNIVTAFRPNAYHIIENKQLTHQDTLWAWDARCSIYDRIIDSFDRLELQRAELDDKKRADYRLVTVPEFVKTLQLERTCPDE